MPLKNLSVKEGTPLMLKLVEKKVPFNEKGKDVMYHLAIHKQGVIDFQTLARHTIEKMGVNRYMAEAMTGMMFEAMTTWLRTGHAVNIANVGTLRPVVNCKAHTNPADCSVDDLYKLKLRFYPCKDLMKQMSRSPLRVRNRAEMIARYKARMERNNQK